jgi:tetratricopeptide (TPR) repeat protein
MTTTERELAPDLHERIKALAAEGNRLVAEARYQDAIMTYNRAWVLVPDPKNDWEASTWLLAAIGDAAFLGGWFGTARKALDEAMTCPGAVGNPFLHLRRGEVALEQGDEDVATDELMRAYMAEGRDIFATEDAKYLAFLSTRVAL